MANWAANRKIGDRNANSHAGVVNNVKVDWKRGPQGQGWHFWDGWVWKGCWQTSAEAHAAAERLFARDLRAHMRELAA